MSKYVREKQAAARRNVRVEPVRPSFGRAAADKLRDEVVARFGVPCDVRPARADLGECTTAKEQAGEYVLSFTNGLRHPRFDEAAAWLEVCRRSRERA